MLASLEPEAPDTVRTTQNPIITKWTPTIRYTLSGHIDTRVQSTRLCERINRILNEIVFSRHDIELTLITSRSPYSSAWKEIVFVDSICQTKFPHCRWSVIEVISEKCFLAEGVDKKLSSFAERSL